MDAPIDLNMHVYWLWDEENVEKTMQTHKDKKDCQSKVHIFFIIIVHVFYDSGLWEKVDEKLWSFFVSLNHRRLLTSANSH